MNMTEEKSFTYDDLYPYQKVGVEFLLSKNGVLLADEMGTGKTVQTICALNSLLMEGQLSRALIVVPAALKNNWHEEVERWMPISSVRSVKGEKEERIGLYKLPIQVLIISYEQLRNDLIDLREIDFDVIIFDEAHRLKNRSSSTNFAARQMRSKRIWALTGTPLENRFEEFVTLLQLIRPDLSNEDSEILFSESLEGHFLRRKKTDVLSEMPEIIDKTMTLELKPSQRLEYGDIWANRTVLRKGGAESFSILNDLKQVCNFHSTTGESIKLDVLKTIYENVKSEGSQNKIIVFSQFVKSLERIEKTLNDPQSIALYHGGMESVKRDAVLDRFRTDTNCNMLLISLKAGGVGLNLQEATHVVIFDRWWNPQLELQAINRAHRFGRELPLLVYRFKIEDSVEQRIVDLLHLKSEAFDFHVEGAAEDAQPTESYIKLILDIGED